MLFKLAHPEPELVLAPAEFTLYGTLTLYGRTSRQKQLITEDYVVTEVERGVFIFLRDRRERFLVDRAASRLRRLEWATQRIRVDRLRPVIGDIEVMQDEGEVERRGFRCRRYRFGNANARVVIAGEALAAAVDGIERTALAAERAFDALDQPFALPLQPSEVVVESRLRTVAADFEQNQVYELERIETGVAERGAYDRMARLAIIS